MATCIKDDMKRSGLSQEDVQSGNKWRGKIQGNWLTSFTRKMAVKTVCVCVCVIVESVRRWIDHSDRLISTGFYLST